jgi:hypothetical protein
MASGVMAACSGSPASPSAASQLLLGQAVNGIDHTGVARANVQVGHGRAVTADADGNFQVDLDAPGTYSAIIGGDTVVEHRTTLDGPTPDRIRIPLIPASFDLQAFDQMFRTANARLQRWTTQPKLLVVASTLAYQKSAVEYTASAEQMSDAEIAQLVTDLTEGLSLLTGATYPSFAAVDVERPAQGDRVNPARIGTIVVGRYTGIPGGFADVIGYGTWHEQSDGAVDGGVIYLDRDFDRGDSRRRLLRIHELGHALGYLHVTTRPSIMNPAIGPEPSDFDRTGAIIAFERPPGNVSPDDDPTYVSRPFSLAPGRWVAPVP